MSFPVPQGEASQSLVLSLGRSRGSVGAAVVAQSLAGWWVPARAAFGFSV